VLGAGDHDDVPATVVGALVAGMVMSISANAQTPPAPLVLEAKIPLGQVSGRIDHLVVDLKPQRLFVAELGNGTIDIIDLAAAFLVGMVAASLPISFAGWGVRESAMLAAFSYAGLPNSDGLLVSILFGAGSFIIGAIGGMAWAFGSNRIRLQSLQAASEKALDL